MSVEVSPGCIFKISVILSRSRGEPRTWQAVPHTDTNQMSAPGRQAHCRVETGNAIYLTLRDIKSLADSLCHLFRNPVQFLLYIQQKLDEDALFSLVLIDNLVNPANFLGGHTSIHYSSEKYRP